MKNFLFFILGFSLVFGFVGKSYATVECRVWVTEQNPGSYSSSAWYGKVALSSTVDWGYTGTAVYSGTVTIANGGARLWYKSGSSWGSLNVVDGVPYSRMLNSEYLALPAQINATVVPYGSDPSTMWGGACPPPPPPECPAGENAGWYSVPGKDLSFGYCLGSCALDSSSVAYNSTANVTIFHGSLNGEQCSSGASASPYVPPAAPVPQCPDGQIWSPSANACVPISSGTGTAPKSTDTTNPDGTPTYNPGDTGYGTPASVPAPGAVTGPQTTTSGERVTTITTINPDGSVTEEKIKEETENPLQAPDGQTDSYNKPSKTINFQNFNNALNSFAQGGPVRLFSDMIHVVQSLVATPSAPIYRFLFAGNYFVLDLTPFEPVAAVSRFMLSLLALVALGFFLLKQWRAG